MPLLNKPALLKRVVDAVRLSGWWVLVQQRNHPFEFSVFRESQRFTVRVYIWNLTHGGGSARPADEQRIQITTVKAPLIRRGADHTLLLGWHERLGVFSGFDATRHNVFSSYSPSVQVHFSTLEAAARNGVALQTKGSQEMVAAFKPSFLMDYVSNSLPLHKAISSQKDSENLVRVAEGKAFSTVGMSQPRQRVAATVAKYWRDSGFRNRVLSAYNHKCAVCGIQLGLVDAAHILPVGERGSTDETNNGLAMCPLHHRAYDAGLVGVFEDYKTAVSAGRLRELRAQNLVGGLREFTDDLFPQIVLPPNTNDHPSPDYLRDGARLRGWP